MIKILLFVLIPFILFAYEPNITGTQGLYQANVASNFTLSGNDIQTWIASAGAIGSTLDSDGANDPVYDSANKLIDFVGGARCLQDVDVYDIGTADFSLMCYFRTGSDIATAQYVLTKGTSGDHYRLLISGSKLYIRIYEGDVYWIDWNGAIAADTDYFVYISLDRDGRQFVYLNDTKVVDQTTTETDDLNNGDNFRIGLGGTTYYFGKVYEVRITNTATTETDKDLYLADLQCRYLDIDCPSTDEEKGYNKYSGYNHYNN